MSPLQRWPTLASRDDPGVTFFVDDSSPLFVYGSSTSSSSWAAVYQDGGEGGSNATQRVASTGNSTIEFDIEATSLSLLQLPYSPCQATLSINGSASQTACPTNTMATTVSDLPPGLHHVVFNSGPLASNINVTFKGITGTRPLDPTGSCNVTIDDTLAGRAPVTWNFTGAWTHLGTGDDSGASSDTDMSGFFNGTLSLSRTVNEAVTLSTPTSAIYLYGPVGPGYGSASMTLDNELVMPSLNLSSPFPTPSVLLWFRTGLDGSATHNLTMTNLEDKQMAVDFAILTTSGDVANMLSSQPPTAGFIGSIVGKLVAFLLVPLLIVLFLLGIMWYLYAGRRSKHRDSHHRQISSQLRKHEEVNKADITSTGFTATGSTTCEGMAESIPGGASSVDAISVSSDAGIDNRVPHRAERSERDTTSRPSNTRILLGVNKNLHVPFRDARTRRQTPLPAYTTGGTETAATTVTSITLNTPGWIMVADGKSHLRETESSRAPSHQRQSASSLSARSITSVFGAPPSVNGRTLSMSTAPDSPDWVQRRPAFERRQPSVSPENNQRMQRSPAQPSPRSARPQPRIKTSALSPTSTVSPASSRVTSAHPLVPSYYESEASAGPVQHSGFKWYQ